MCDSIDLIRTRSFIKLELNQLCGYSKWPEVYYTACSFSDVQSSHKVQGHKYKYVPVNKIETKTTLSAWKI